MNHSKCPFIFVMAYAMFIVRWNQKSTNHDMEVKQTKIQIILCLFRVCSLKIKQDALEFAKTNYTLYCI